MSKKKVAPKKSTVKKASDKEELFVAAYLANGGNATKAAELAGYSAKSAHQRGHELMARPHVVAAIQAARTRIVKKLKVTAERVVEEMALISFSNIRNFRRTELGDIELAPGVDESAWRAVKRLKYKVRHVPQKDAESIVEIDTEFELWSKDAQLRNLGEYLKLFKENRAGDDTPDDELTTQQRKDRILSILRAAAKRKKQNRSARA